MKRKERTSVKSCENRNQSKWDEQRSRYLCTDGTDILVSKKELILDR